jgi:hypothetical protein
MISVTASWYWKSLYVWTVGHVSSSAALWLLSECHFSDLEISGYCAGVFVTMP